MANIKKGKYSYGENLIDVYDYNIKDYTIYIGNFTSIANGVKIYINPSATHYHRTGTSYPFGYIHKNIFSNYKEDVNFDNTKNDIIIGNDVWIGAGATLISGITVGDGSVIATNSYVFKDVEPYSIVGGNPSKLIGYRFSKDIIEEFLKLKWWDLVDYKINIILPLLQQKPTKKIFKEIYKELEIYG